TNAKGDGFYSSDAVQNYTTNNFFRYNTTFGEDHDLDAVAGMTFQEQKTMNSYTEAAQFPSDAYKKLSSASSKTDASTSETQFSLLSYLARANYNFKDR